MTHERNKWRPRFWSFLLFTLGLILGWFVLGWWLWPIQWINVAPWQLSPEGQRAYLAAVAEGYTLTGDVAVMQERLTGWDNEALTQVIAFMIQETPDAAAQQRLNNLREALTLPQVNVTFLDLILGQKAIIVTLIAAAILLSVAVGLALYPSWQQARATQLEAQRLADEEETMVAAATQVQTQTTAAEGNGSIPEETMAGAAADNDPAQPPITESQTDGGSADGVVAAGRATTQATKPQPQGATEALPTTQATAPPRVGTRPDGQLTAGEQPNAEKLLIDVTESIQELLTSVFDDEEKTAHFDILLKGTDEVDVTKLMRLAEQVRQQLRQQNEATL
jgi:hypothetical protein